MKPSNPKQEKVVKEIKCLNCGEYKEVIKRKKLFCATVTNTESGYETDSEFPRHRFTPYSKKELEAIKADEDEYIKQMGEMADFFNKQTSFAQVATE